MHLWNSWTALDVHLHHPALAVGVSRLRRERRDLLGLLVVERDVGDQVADHRERPHRRHRDRLGSGRSRSSGSCTSAAAGR